MNLNALRRNLDAVRTRIAAAATRAGRDPASITLVGVTKKTTAPLAAALADLGLLDLGENYPQELWRKADALADHLPPIRWHLIGHLQSNKAARTYPRVKMIHGVDSLKLLQLLDNLAADNPDPAPVCLQVNCSGEASKYGWSPDALLDDADAIAACRRVPLVGLMTIAALADSPEQARPAFQRLRATRDALQLRLGLPLPELSMGMSNDYVAAVAEGATMVRVGSALWEGVSE